MLSRLKTLACALAIFGLNAYVAHKLFRVEFTQALGSIDAAFIAFARWLADHWDDRLWFPMWVTGTPVRQVYNPVLHTSVAALIRAGLTPPHAYHLLTGITYCLGPVTLFWLCWKGSGSRPVAILAAAMYSTLSPSLFLSSTLRGDASGFLEPRRLQVLVDYGEGPHVTAVMMIPLVIWLIDQAAGARRWIFLTFAPVGLATLVLTNWTGTTGLVMALAAYGLSKLGAKPDQQPLHWPTLAGISVTAYALACYWIPPSLIRTVQESSAAMEETHAPPAQKLVLMGALTALLLGLHVVFQKARASSWPRFFVYLALIAASATLGKLWFGISVVPIGHRFQVEMEMGILGALAFGLVHFARRLPKPMVCVLIALAIFGVVRQSLHYRRRADDKSRAIDFTATTEYRFAQWFAKNANGRRVFVPGTSSYWMNLYSDTPQFYGCCDQSIRDMPHRAATYVIYSSDGTDRQAGEVSALWLKLYGVELVAVAEPSQAGQPYLHPKKFDGLLEELYRDGQNAVYAVPGLGGTLAHVVNRSALPQREPIHGVDLEPIRPLADALSAKPAPMLWTSQHELRIQADTAPGEVVHLQQTFDAGWRAYEGSRELKVEADHLGLTVVDPGAPGPHEIRMSYEGTQEDRMARWAQIVGLLAIGIWTTLARRFSQRVSR